MVRASWRHLPDLHADPALLPNELDTGSFEGAANCQKIGAGQT